MKLKIACPQCHWEPDGGDYWRCSCGYVWDTFATGGHCPCCGKEWKLTSCVPEFLGGCRQWSPHLDWYRNLDELLEAEIVVISRAIPSPTSLSDPDKDDADA